MKYVIPKLLNEENGFISSTSKVHIHSYYGYHRYVKNVMLNDDPDICLIRTVMFVKSIISDTCESVILGLIAMMYYCNYYV